MSGFYNNGGGGGVDSEHRAATANVHGLPANVNVFGNRNVVGEFIQRGTGALSSVGATAVTVGQGRSRLVSRLAMAGRGRRKVG